MKPFESKIQVGKSGLTSGVLESILNATKNHKVVKISVLKTLAKTKADCLPLIEKLEAFLSKQSIKHKTRLIGHTIILRKL
jgi:RNA-binding protein YhbY